MKSLEEVPGAVQQINISRHVFTDDGTYPNNGHLPLVVYQNALQSSEARIIIELFESNDWINAWEGGVFDYHHYHSTAHEVLAIVKGTALILFGGPKGQAIPVSPGDVVVIPAGVAHCLLESDDEFSVVGAYPQGQTYDIKKGEENDRPEADQNIERVPLPSSDPVYGIDGPLLKNWSPKPVKKT